MIPSDNRAFSIEGFIRDDHRMYGDHQDDSSVHISGKQISDTVISYTLSGHGNGQPHVYDGYLVRNRTEATPWVSHCKNIGTGYHQCWASIHPANEITSSRVRFPNGMEMELEHEGGTQWNNDQLLEFTEKSLHGIDGILLFTMEGADGKTYHDFAMLNGAFPTAFPELITPENLDIVAPDQPVEFQWKPAPTNSTTLIRVFGAEHGGSDHVDPSLQNYELPAGSLDTNKLDSVYVEFANRFHQFRSERITRRRVLLNATGQTPAPEIMLVRSRDEDGDLFAIRCETDAPSRANSGQIETPNGYQIAFDRDFPEGNKWIALSILSESNNLPNGEYISTFNLDDSSVVTGKTTIAGTFPEQIPQIISDHEIISSDLSEDMAISWSNAPADTVMLMFMVDQIDAIPASQRIALNAPQVYSQDWFGPSALTASNAVIPVGRLKADSTYQVFVVCFTETGQMAHGCSAKPIYIETAPTPYRAWCSMYFNEMEMDDSTVSGKSADPDGDQRPNIEEYVALTNPKSKNDGAVIVLNAPTMQFEHKKVTGENGEDFIYEYSHNLQDWYRMLPALITETPSNSVMRIPEGTQNNAMFIRVTYPVD